MGACYRLDSDLDRAGDARVLVDEQDHIAGFYTLATGQVDFGDLPPDLVKKLPPIKGELKSSAPVATHSLPSAERGFQRPATPPRSPPSY